MPPKLSKVVFKGLFRFEALYVVVIVAAATISSNWAFVIFENDGAMDGHEPKKVWDNAGCTRCKQPPVRQQGMPLLPLPSCLFSEEGSLAFRGAGAPSGVVLFFQPPHSVEM